MIEKLQIRNYGANKKRDIEFSPYVTTITGKSFIGKSWILRALRWVSSNKPAGDSFINWEAERANVRLTAEGKKITRTRSKSINTYQLDKIPYTAFGNDVPKDIAEVLNLSDINFQGVNVLGQHEPPFLFCKTAGEVSRQLNNIINLEVIDTTLSNIASEYRKATTTIEITQSRLGEVVAKKKQFLYAEDLNRDFTNVEELQKRRQKSIVETASMGELLDTAVKHLSIGENAAQTVLGGKLAISKGDTYQDITNQIQNLLELVQTGGDYVKAVDTRPPSLKHVEKLRVEAERVSNQYAILNDVVKSIVLSKEQKCQAEKEIKIFKKELKEIAGGRCPLCGAILMK